MYHDCDHMQTIPSPRVPQQPPLAHLSTENTRAILPTARILFLITSFLWSTVRTDSANNIHVVRLSFQIMPSLMPMASIPYTRPSCWMSVPPPVSSIHPSSPDSSAQLPPLLSLLVPPPPILINTHRPDLHQSQWDHLLPSSWGHWPTSLWLQGREGGGRGWRGREGKKREGMERGGREGEEGRGWRGREGKRREGMEREGHNVCTTTTYMWWCVHKYMNLTYHTQLSNESCVCQVASGQYYTATHTNTHIHTHILQTMPLWNVLIDKSSCGSGIRY